MAIRDLLTASPVSLSDVLSNGKRYVVPMFQRDYAWGEDEWDALWGDIVATVEAGEGAHHFLGALVLQRTVGEGAFHIIDGQQRMVTLSLLALAIITRIERIDDPAERDNNRERARLLRERFVSTRDAASLQHRSRLKLNASDDGFYQTYLVQGVDPPRPKGLKGSERRLYDCYRYFSTRLEARLGPGADGATLATFLEHEVAGRLRFRMFEWKGRVAQAATSDGNVLLGEGILARIFYDFQLPSEVIRLGSPELFVKAGGKLPIKGEGQ